MHVQYCHKRQVRSVRREYQTPTHVLWCVVPAVRCKSAFTDLCIFGSADSLSSWHFQGSVKKMNVVLVQGKMIRYVHIPDEVDAIQNLQDHVSIPTRMYACADRYGEFVSRVHASGGLN